MNKEDQINVGLRFKEIRKTLNLGQSELANIAGVSRSLLSLCENGTKTPSYQLLVALATKLNIDINWLISGNGDMFTGPKIDYGALTDEMQDMFFHIEHIPELRLHILEEFLHFKIRNKEKIEKQLSKERKGKEKGRIAR